MPERLVRYEKAIEAGLTPSLPHDKTLLWEDGRNALFKESSVQPIPGQQTLFIKQENAPPVGALEILLGGEPSAFWGSQAKLWRGRLGIATPIDVTRLTDGATYTGIRDATATQLATQWSFARWGTWVAATNGVDKPQLWKLSAPDNFANFAEPPPFDSAEIFRTIGAYLIAYNTDNGDALYEWSHTDNPEIFTPTATNAAGNAFIRNLGSPIIAVEGLGKGHGVYGWNQLFYVEFIGAPFYFADSHLLEGIGAVSKDSIQPVGKLHYGFGPHGIFRTDGLRFDYIDTPAIHDFIYNDLNTDQVSKVCSWYDASEEVVFWSYPSEGSIDNDTTVGFCPYNSTWSIHDFARTAATNAAVFEFPLLFDNGGNVWHSGQTGASPISPGTPLQLNALSTLQYGWGYMGWGEGGWGGWWQVTG